jgi:hypothetical protein
MDTRSLILRSFSALLVVLALAPLALAQEGRRSGPGTGNPDIQLVPWKFVQGDTLVHDAPVTLYWIPGSTDESQRSPMLDSKPFLAAATRCVGFEIVMPDRTAMIQKLGLTGKIPAAAIVDREGKIVRTVEANDHSLSTLKVEKMLDEELATHDQTMYRQIMAASQAAAGGRNKEAIDLYTKIWDDRCLYPTAAAEARRGLKDLGVTVTETPKSAASH